MLAVGASDPNGTIDPRDDVVPGFSARGSQLRHVDMVAPGMHVLGLRDPGSFVDVNYPDARVGTRFLRGSGTSQATAITAGAVALYLQRYPKATPDEVKRAFMSSATPLSGVPALLCGAGSVQVRRAEQAPLDTTATPSTSLDGLGTGRLQLVPLGTSRIAGAWSGRRWTDAAWTVGDWR